MKTIPRCYSFILAAEKRRISNQQRCPSNFVLAYRHPFLFLEERKEKEIKTLTYHFKTHSTHKTDFKTHHRVLQWSNSLNYDLHNTNILCRPMSKVYK